MITDLKQKHFPHTPDKPLILHRSDIINKKGSFWRLRDIVVERNFNEELLSFFKTMQYVIVTVVIDKKSHFERYGESAMHPYHYCLAALLERYCGFLKFHKAAGDVLAESRGREEDVQLKNAYIHVYTSGTFYHSAAFFQEGLSSREIKIKPKIANIAGTQLADLLAHPSKQEILFDHKLIVQYEERFGDKIREAIQQKYNQRFINSQVEGYGKVFLA